MLISLVALTLFSSETAAMSDIPLQQVTFNIPAATIDMEIIEGALAPMRSMINDERRRQEALPEPASDSDRLVRMGRLDQIARRGLAVLDLENLRPEEANAVRARALGLIFEIDEQNQKDFRELRRPNRWFSKAEYGEEAAAAAFFIVQHANEDLWREYLPLLEPLVGSGEIDDAQYALMYDRLAVAEGRPQRYGSQFVCNGRESQLAELEDPENVDARRAAMGMTSMAENAQRFANGNPCQLLGRP